jgi:hypothetical protein
MEGKYTQKTVGTSLFIVLLAVAMFTAAALVSAAASEQGQTSGQGKKLGHIYGVGNGGTPPGQR